MSAARILVVDDNEANRELARAALEDEGYQVILASDAASAVAAFVRDQPDVVLLDVRMPDVDGFAACEQIRSLPQGPETPILFLTALRDVETFDHALRAGGDDFLTKPVRPTELVIRVQSALKLRRMNAELRDHYELLKRQRDDLQRLQLQKERLMAFVVHDLKNPVNAMDLHAQFVMRDPGLNASTRDSATQIRSEARQLTRMIHNLLDVSRADEGELVLQPTRVDLQRLVQAVIADLGVTARSCEVTIESAIESVDMVADEDLLRRMLANLVENAIRYAPRQTVVSVTGQRVDGTVELRVSDAGVGIPVDMRERVFAAFVQVDAGERGSRGLGLTFCKLAVEAHGGRIWIEDAMPGAMFCVNVPDHAR